MIKINNISFKKLSSIAIAFIVFCTGLLITDQNKVYASQASGITSGKVYTIENVASGKFLNPHYGYDADGTNVYQWTEDGSTEQKFKFVYDSSQGAYRIYTMCSSNGTNRVLDIVKSNGSIVNGCNVEIWRPTDPYAQLWVISKNSDGSYYIKPKNNTSLYLRVVNRYNGSGSGTTSSSSGNAYIGYASGSYHKWNINEVSTPARDPAFVNWSYMYKLPYYADYVSQEYHYGHYGVDITTGITGQIDGYPVNNVAYGKVIKKGTFSDNVTTVVSVKHRGEYTSRYLHMINSNSIVEGNYISSGTQVGTTSNINYGVVPGTNYHLHYDVNNVDSIYGSYNGSLFNFSNTVDPQNNVFPDILL